MSPLKTDLWPHQQTGVERIVSQDATLLAFGMRAGKTLTTLASIEARKANRVLIIAGKAPCTDVWEYQIAQHTDWTDVTNISTGSIKKRAEKAKNATVSVPRRD